MNLIYLRIVLRNLAQISKQYGQAATSMSSIVVSVNKRREVRFFYSAASSSEYETIQTLKAMGYGIFAGFGITFLYAEYENSQFRRQFESRIPFGSTVLNFLDKVINPVFGRHKKFATMVPQKPPSPERLSRKKEIYDTPEQDHDIINDVYDKLLDAISIRRILKNAKNQLEDGAKFIRDTFNKVTPEFKSYSDEQSRKDSGPTHIKEDNEVTTSSSSKR